MGFDFERMTSSFELVQADFAILPSTTAHSRPLPSTSRFLHAMGEVLLLFETLGSAFTFVKRDIEKKLSVISRYAAAHPANFSDLNDAVFYERGRASLHARLPDGTPSCARTLLRLMWALKFADSLLDGLGQAFDPASKLRSYDRTLKWAVARAYDDALAEHHSWTIRRSVKGACLLLPTKEVFMDRVGVDLDRSEEFILRLSFSMSPLVKRMYTFYEKHDLLGLP